MRRILIAFFTAFRRSLLWGSGRRRVFTSSLCCHVALISSSTPGSTYKSCAPREGLEHVASSAAVESMTPAMSVVMSLMQVVPSGLLVVVQQSSCSQLVIEGSGQSSNAGGRKSSECSWCFSSFSGVVRTCIEGGLSHTRDYCDPILVPPKGDGGR